MDRIHFRNNINIIDTRFRTLYFQFFRNPIAFNDFLYIQLREKTLNCCFCEKYSETLIHVFCDPEVVIPLWIEMNNHKEGVNFSVSASIFDKKFGIESDKFLTFFDMLTEEINSQFTSTN